MDRTGPKMGFRSPKCGKNCQKWIEQVPKMDFRSPKCGKNCQKWIEQVQKWVKGARRVEKTVKNGQNGSKKGFLEALGPLKVPKIDRIGF